MIKGQSAISYDDMPEEIGRMLNSMMEKSNSIRGPLDSTPHESTVEYFTSPDETATAD